MNLLVPQDARSDGGAFRNVVRWTIPVVVIIQPFSLPITAFPKIVLRLTKRMHGWAHPGPATRAGL